MRSHSVAGNVSLAVPLCSGCWKEPADDLPCVTLGCCGQSRSTSRTNWRPWFTIIGMHRLLHRRKQGQWSLDQILPSASLHGTTGQRPFQHLICRNSSKDQKLIKPCWTSRSSWWLNFRVQTSPSKLVADVRQPLHQPGLQAGPISALMEAFSLWTSLVWWIWSMSLPARFNWRGQVDHSPSNLSVFSFSSGNEVDHQN